MPTNHGIDYVVVNDGAVPVEEVATSITAIIGTAPQGDSQVLKLIRNPTEAAQFGSQLPGYTLPQALETHFKEGGASAICINVADSSTMEAKNVTLVLVAGAGTLLVAPIPSVPVVVKDNAGAVTYVKGTDYTIDDYGRIKVTGNGVIAQNASLKITYSGLKDNIINAALLVGTISGTGVAKGMKLLQGCMNAFGFEPKIFICPGYSDIAAVRQELAYWAEKQLGIFIADTPLGTTVSVAVAGRLPSGTISFNFSNRAGIPTVPWLKSYDPMLDGLKSKPYSPYLSGLLGRVHREEGFWVSPSNHAFKTVEGLDVDITGSFFDKSLEANSLNDVGYVTAVNKPGAGWTCFGNRNASYPSNVDPGSFIATEIIKNTLVRSLQFAMSPYLDKPITKQIIDAIRSTCQNYINDLKGRGALIDGLCIWDAQFNSMNNLLLGKLVFVIDYTPPLAAENIQLRVHLDNTKYTTLFETI